MIVQPETRKIYTRRVDHPRDRRSYTKVQYMDEKACTCNSTPWSNMRILELMPTHHPNISKARCNSHDSHANHHECSEKRNWSESVLQIDATNQNEPDWYETQTERKEDRHPSQNFPGT